MTTKFGYHFKSESSDEYTGGSWDSKPSNEEVALKILKDCWFECEQWIEIEYGKTEQWAMENPIEALSLCNIDPTIVEL